jgi:hypothetical protein
MLVKKGVGNGDSAKKLEELESQYYKSVEKAREAEDTKNQWKETIRIILEYTKLKLQRS